MVKKQPVCGIAPLKKNQKRGNMKECAEKSQVRYWGLKKVDQRTLDSAKNAKKRKQESKKLTIKIGTLSGKINKLKKDLPYEKNNEKKKEMQKKINELKKDLSKVIQEFNKTKVQVVAPEFREPLPEQVERAKVKPEFKKLSKEESKNIAHQLDKLIVEMDKFKKQERQVDVKGIYDMIINEGNEILDSLEAKKKGEFKIIPKTKAKNVAKKIDNMKLKIEDVLPKRKTKRYDGLLDLADKFDNILDNMEGIMLKDPIEHPSDEKLSKIEQEHAEIMKLFDIDENKRLARAISKHEREHEKLPEVPRGGPEPADPVYDQDLMRAIMEHDEKIAKRSKKPVHKRGGPDPGDPVYDQDLMRAIMEHEQKYVKPVKSNFQRGGPKMPNPGRGRRGGFLSKGQTYPEEDPFVNTKYMEGGARKRIEKDASVKQIQTNDRKMRKEAEDEIEDKQRKILKIRQELMNSAQKLDPIYRFKDLMSVDDSISSLESYNNMLKADLTQDEFNELQEVAKAYNSVSDENNVSYAELKRLAEAMNKLNLPKSYYPDNYISKERLSDLLRRLNKYISTEEVSQTNKQRSGRPKAHVIKDDDLRGSGQPNTVGATGTLIQLKGKDRKGKIDLLKKKNKILGSGIVGGCPGCCSCRAIRGGEEPVAKPPSAPEMKFPLSLPPANANIPIDDIEPTNPQLGEEQQDYDDLTQEQIAELQELKKSVKLMTRTGLSKAIKKAQEDLNNNMAQIRDPMNVQIKGALEQERNFIKTKIYILQSQMRIIRFKGIDVPEQNTLMLKRRSIAMSYRPPLRKFANEANKMDTSQLNTQLKSVNKEIQETVKDFQMSKLKKVQKELNNKYNFLAEKKNIIEKNINEIKNSKNTKRRRKKIKPEIIVKQREVQAGGLAPELIPAMIGAKVGARVLKKVIGGKVQEGWP